MAEDVRTAQQDASKGQQAAAERDKAITRGQNGEAAEDEDEDEEDEEDEEPKLKYAKLTGSLTNVYRNGDSTSTCTVAGDKMVLGTHNGNIHVLGIPSLQPLRTYHAHSATITSVSISPTPPPPPSIHHVEAPVAASLKSPAPSLRSQPTSSSLRPNTRTPQQPQPIPNTPNNAIHVATSSLDGHVTITSLLDPKYVQHRNFARPLNAVSLSPDYRNDRTYLSGGHAGQLILTIGGKAGVTVDANTNSAAAAAGGWLGSLGLGGDRGKDTVLHSGEGRIGEIQWSLSGKWVVWINEEGIKIMRSHLKLGSEEEEDAWRRIAHASRPNRGGWDEGAGVWRGRAQWVDERKIERDDEEPVAKEVVLNGNAKPAKKPSKVEKLIVGWGNTAWVMLVTEHGTDAAGKKVVGSADIVHKLHFGDCIISGITMFTPNVLAILAYRTVDDDDNPITQVQPNKTRKGRSHRHTGLAPQLRLVELNGVEVDVDELSISRFETLSAQDYHLSTLFIPPPPPIKSNPADSQKGALEGLWDAAGGKYATRIFSSGASVLSRSSDGDRTASVVSPPASSVGVGAASGPATKKRRLHAHPYIVEPGLKLFVQSPYDCVLAVKRGLSDRLEWMMEQKEYAQAWELVDQHPDVVPTPSGSDGGTSIASPRSTKAQGSLAEFFTDTATSASGDVHGSAVEGEKRRIGDLWLQQLINAGKWAEAGKVAEKVLGTSSRWEHWVWTFAQADKFDDITPHIPGTADAQLPGVVYEVILGHYVQADPERLKTLIEEWDPRLELYDASSVIKAIEARLDQNDDETQVREDTEDRRLLTESLARLYLAEGRAREALRCWIRVQNADAAFRLLREEKLVDVVAAEDVTGLLMLRVSKEMLQHSDKLSELEEASSEAIGLLVDEALRGTVLPATVISQLENRGPRFRPFIFFYFRALWNASSCSTTTFAFQRQSRRRKFDTLNKDEGHALVEDHADLAVSLFAQYDRPLLLTFLKSSNLYNYEKAAAICENLNYIPELVHILSKTGQTKPALFLIIDELSDVKQAIDFVKENPDLWEDLLEYGMDKPVFVRGLLEEVGTSMDPVKLIRRIPVGMEVEGLKTGVEKLIREFDIQMSISEGVAKVLRGEVEVGMETLRAGRGKGLRFEVFGEKEGLELEVKAPPVEVDGEEVAGVAKHTVQKEDRGAKPGRCVGCGDVFHEDEKEYLLGFACGHVYHLSCLLRTNPDTSDPKVLEDLLNQLGSGKEDEESGALVGRRVGSKVIHAHIIRRVVKGGCGVCAEVEGA